MAIHLPDRISYLLLLARVGPRLGWAWTWLLRKRWLAPIGLLGTFALKTFCREAGAIPSYCISRGIYPEACSVCSPNIFVVFYSGSSLAAFLALHSRFAILSGKRVS
jgi:hypothetical protein